MNGRTSTVDTLIQGRADVNAVDRVRAGMSGLFSAGRLICFFCMGFFFLCVCVPICIYEYIYVYDICEYCAYMYITYIYRYVLPSTLKFFFFRV